MPGFKAAEIDGRLEEAGIDMVYIYCVNDGAVMSAWKDNQGLGGSDLIEFVGDTQAEITEACGLMITDPGPRHLLGAHTKRCKRSAMYVDDGVIKVIQISEGPTPDGKHDPAGDDYPDMSCVENMLKLIAAL